MNGQYELCNASIVVGKLNGRMLECILWFYRSSIGLEYLVVSVSLSIYFCLRDFADFDAGTVSQLSFTRSSDRLLRFVYLNPIIRLIVVGYISWLLVFLKALTDIPDNVSVL